MCCLPSVLFVGIGLMSISAGDALSKGLYFGPARWLLYAISVGLLSYGLVQHFRSQGICDMDAAKRERRQIVNTTLMTLTIAVSVYFVVNHVLLQLIGEALGMPWAKDAFWR
jgi:hypothetical protein